MLIAEGKLRSGELQGKVVVVTGAAGGIGYEAARALLWLGARVVIADINRDKGIEAERKLNLEFGDKVRFHHTDVGNEQSVAELYSFSTEAFGAVYAVINNATIAVVGAVQQVPIDRWDQSYAVNLRGPVIITRTFLPAMLYRNEGVIIFVSSSGAAPYLGGYEVFKTGQVELGNTLAAEVENTGVHVFTVGPGIIKTETADNAIRQLAPLYGMSVDDFCNMNASQLLSAEAAGAGFAAAVALAERYRGTEVGSIQALTDAGISLDVQAAVSAAHRPEELGRLLAKASRTLAEQVEGWSKRNIFERQWMFRDFRKHTGFAAEVFVQSMHQFATECSKGNVSVELRTRLEKLVAYYEHMLKLMKGYERNPAKVEEHTQIINGWITEVRDVLNKL